MALIREGDRFKDSNGVGWYVVHTVTPPRGDRLLLVKHDSLLTNQWRILIDNQDGTVTNLEDGTLSDIRQCGGDGS